MKKLFTKFSLLFIGLMLCAGNAWGQEPVQLPDLMGKYYILDDENHTATLAVQQPLWQFGDLEIPGVVTYEEQDYTVTAIAANAFAAGITPLGSIKIILPASIASIGASAFVNSDNITFVVNSTMPPAIQANSFPSGATIQVPAASKMIYDALWSSYEFNIITESAQTCGDGLTWDIQNNTLTISFDGVGSGVMDDFDFNAMAFAPWLMRLGEIYAISLPEGLTNIGYGAFASLQNVTSVSIPSTVTSIGDYAFAGCTALRTLTIPTTVSSVGEHIIGEGTVLINEGTSTTAIARPIQHNGNYNTLCLPFSMNAEQIANSDLADAEIFEFANATKEGDELDLHFRPVTTLTAGVPYFFRYTTNADNLTELNFSGVTVSTTEAQSVTHNGVTLQGTLSTVSVSGSDNLYLAANDELHWSSSDKTVYPFRAYFSVAGVSGAAPRARIVTRTNTTTGMDNVLNDKVQSAKVLENGHLFILKNGVKYNAQGQIVK